MLFVDRALPGPIFKAAARIQAQVAEKTIGNAAAAD